MKKIIIILFLIMLIQIAGELQKIYLPLVQRPGMWDIDITPSPTFAPDPLPQYSPLPDEFELLPTSNRFGVNEYIYENALGFDKENYHAIQWSQQDYRSRLIYLRTANRTHDGSRWCVGSWRVQGYPDRCVDPSGKTISTKTGWVNEFALRNWIKNNPGHWYRIGNEPGCPDPCGDGIGLSEYVEWYYKAWQLIKFEDPTAVVGYGIPIGWTWKASTLVKMWDLYYGYTGNLMPTDYHPIHRYVVHGSWTIQGEIDFLTERMNFLDAKRGISWEGRPYYMLDEFGMLSWRYDVPVDQQIEYMSAIVPWLMSQDRIAEWAWWPAWNEKCSDTCGHLIDHNGNLTELGNLYHDLEMGDWR